MKTKKAMISIAEKHLDLKNNPSINLSQKPKRNYLVNVDQIIATKKEETNESLINLPLETSRSPIMYSLYNHNKALVNEFQDNKTSKIRR